MILEGAFGFRDAEWAVAQVSKRFFRVRCSQTTSQGIHKNKKIIAFGIHAPRIARARSPRNAMSFHFIAVD
jgi:hypothetical protein